MKPLCGLILLTLAFAAFGHPGGGIVALSENSALIADSVENFIWLVEKGHEPKRLVSKFHGHWLTRGRDGQLYTEAFQESGGAWSSAAFRLEWPTGKLTEMAHRRELEALSFAVDRDGSLVFQRGGSLVSRRNGVESPFRSSAETPKLVDVTAYAWSPEGDLVFADQNRIRRTDLNGVTRLVAEIEGKVLEPKIWNGTDTPSIFGLAIDNDGHVLAAVPGLDKVYRVEQNRVLQEFARGAGGWRVTGVAALADSIFFLESDSRASTSPRVRLLRRDGTTEILPLPHRAK